MIKTVNIIGAGKVASAFFNQLTSRGVAVKTVYARTSNDLMKVYGSALVNDIRALNQDVDLNIVCVSDKAIPEVLAQLPQSIPAVHTSGSTPASVFNGFKNSGILYPLQTFSTGREVDLSSTWFLLEASVGFESGLANFCKTFFSDRILFCNSDQRATIHLSAVFANNFTNYLLTCAENILADKSIDFQILEPLVKETVSKAFSIGPAMAQTGPAVRKDEETIKKHLAALNDENLKAIYRLLTDDIMRKTDRV